MATEKGEGPSSSPQAATPDEKEGKDVVVDPQTGSEEEQKKKSQRPEREATFQDYLVWLDCWPAS